MDDIQTVIETMLERDHYYNGANIGDIEPCENCGMYGPECISNVEDENGVHTWQFRCKLCGYETGERW